MNCVFASGEIYGEFRVYTHIPIVGEKVLLANNLKEFLSQKKGNNSAFQIGFILEFNGNKHLLKIPRMLLCLGYSITRVLAKYFKL
jgi:hypothetical protein